MWCPARCSWINPATTLGQKEILRHESCDLQWEETVQEAEVWRAGIDLCWLWVHLCLTENHRQILQPLNNSVGTPWPAMQSQIPCRALTTDLQPVLLPASLGQPLIHSPAEPSAGSYSYGWVTNGWVTKIPRSPRTNGAEDCLLPLKVRFLKECLSMGWETCFRTCSWGQEGRGGGDGAC